MEGIHKINMTEEIQIFGEHEGTLLKLDPTVDAAWLLQQKGLYYLKDVLRVIPIIRLRLVDTAKMIGPERAWSEMGMRKYWTHWVCKMEVFAVYLQTNRSPVELRPRRRVEAQWDANQLLTQEGVFFFNEVLEKLPFTSASLRYQWRRLVQAKGCEAAYREMGLFKSEHDRSFLVDMDIFSKYIKKVWQGKR